MKLVMTFTFCFETWFKVSVQPIPTGTLFVKSELNMDKGKEYDPDKESAMTCDLKAWFKVTAHPTLYKQTLWVNQRGFIFCIIML